MAFCPSCGNEIKEGARFCPKCGASIPQSSINKTNSNINNVTKNKSSSFKKIGLIIGALILVILIAAIVIGMLTPNTTISVEDLKIVDEGYGLYAVSGNLVPDKDYDYLEMVVVFYDSSGTIIEKNPLVWNMNGITKDQSIKITGTSYITSSQKPSKAEVYFFDSPFSANDLSDSIYNETLEFSSGGAVSVPTSTSSSSSGSLSISSCSFSTENRSDALTYCDAYVGQEHSGESVKISVLYSRDGSNLNNGNIVPKTVDSSGYISVPSASAFSKFPDKAIVTIYDSNGNTLDTRTYNLAIKSGTQTF